MSGEDTSMREYRMTQVRLYGVVALALAAFVVGRGAGGGAGGR